MIAKQYTYLQGQIAAAERRIGDARLVIKNDETQIAFLKTWADQLEEAICRGCGGHGEVRVFYAQDECKIEQCGRCKGSGVRSPSPTESPR